MRRGVGGRFCGVLWEFCMGFVGVGRGFAGFAGSLGRGVGKWGFGEGF